MSDDTKSCLGCLSGLCLYVGLWILLVPIADDWGMSRIFFAIANFFITSAITSSIYSLYEKYEDNVLENKRNQCESIKKSYPNAFTAFCRDNNITHVLSLSKESADKILSVSYSTWANREKKILEEKERRRKIEQKADELKSKYPKGYEEWKKKFKMEPTKTIIASSENEIKSAELNVIKAEKYQEWEKNQKEHSHSIYEDAKEILKNFGRYSYSIPVENTNISGLKGAFNYKIWQLFAHSVCIENDVDYEYCPAVKRNTKYIEEYRNRKSKLHNSTILEFCTFININTIGSDIIAVFNDCIEGWSKEAYDFHYKDIINGLNESVKIEWLSNCKENNSEAFENKIIFVIDIFTTNDNLKNICKKIIAHYGKGTLLSYFSMLKNYDRTEINEIIKKKKEEHQKKIEEEKQRAQKIKEEQEAIKNIPSKVENWEKICSIIPHKYLLYYYPTTCDFEANEYEWADRRLVWHFKNTPGKTSSLEHEMALRNVVPRFSEILKKTFSSSLKYLTLVCIPASSQEKTVSRYKEFSERLCKETGMINSFDYIKVRKEAEEKHNGGNGLSLKNVEFDEDFFKNKLIVLFDDIVTKGNSMLSFRTKMRLLDANVICALSIGKTKHERVDFEDDNEEREIRRRVIRHRPMPIDDDFEIPDLPF